MPTGYTAGVQSGEITEFRDFALACARAFGALVTMRDDPADAPIPNELKPHTSYYDDGIEKAKNKLLELERMTEAECYAAASAERDQERREIEERQERRDRERARYEAMLKQAQAFNAPTLDHEKFRDFMIEQLVSSIDFDCDNSYDKPAPFMDGTEWRAEKIRKARRDIDYYTIERDKELKRTEGRNLWLKQLREALK